MILMDVSSGWKIHTTMSRITFNFFFVFGESEILMKGDKSELFLFLRLKEFFILRSSMWVKIDAQKLKEKLEVETYSHTSLNGTLFK